MVRTGFVTIAKYGEEQHHVMFCPNDWGGFVKPISLTGRAELAEFLRDLGIMQKAVKDALLQVEQEGSAHLPGISVSDQRRIELGLILEDVLTKGRAT